MGFKPAVRRKRLLRAAFFGPTGSGKTLTSLRLMRHIVGPQGTIAMIDTERGRANNYADIGFDTAWLKHYAASDYIAEIQNAAEGGYDGLIIDSMSHAWEGEGGLLQLIDQVQAEAGKDGKGNTFKAWGDERVRGFEHRLWSAVLDFPGHVIVTMRSKQQYEVDKDANGKTRISKVGLAPIQRANIEYEFDLVCRFTQDNEMIIEKATDPEQEFQGRCVTKPGEDFFAELAVWLNRGDTRMDEYRARINKTCAEVGQIIGKTAKEVGVLAREIIGNKFGTEDIETLCNKELDEIPDLIRALVESPQEQAQERQAKRDNRRKEAASGVQP